MEEVDHFVRRKKRLRGHRNRGLVLLGILLILLGLHFWLIKNAERILERMVEKQSNGHYHLLVKKVHLSYDLHRLILINPQLTELNKSETNEKLKFRAGVIYMKLHSVANLLFDKRLVVDSMSCSRPSLQILAGNIANMDTSISITEQITNTYQQIQNVLNMLQVKKLMIRNGSFEVTPGNGASGIPTIINKINLHIFNFRIDSTKLIDVNRDFLSDNVEFNCGPQKILLHNGQQSFSFSNFHLSTKDSTCRIDSARFTSQIPGQVASYYNISAANILLKKGNLKRLYYRKTFQVDSVFVDSASVYIKLFFDKKDTTKRTTSQKLGKVLLRIADKAVFGYVSVPNTSVTVTAISHGKSSTLNVVKQSLTIKGLVLNANSKKIYSIQKAALSLHNYSFKTADSSLNMRLESIGLDNDTLQLNNFSLFHQSKPLGRSMQWQVSQISLQHFLLDELIINKKLVADATVLYRPVITVQQNLVNISGNNHKKVSTTLANIDKRISIAKAEILDGTINIIQPGFTTTMQNVNGNIDLQKMMSFKQDAIFSQNNSVLRVGKWEINSPPVSILMNNVQTDGKTGHLQAAEALIQTANKKIRLNNLQADSLNIQIINRHLQNMKATHLSWDNGEMNIYSPGKDSTQKSNPVISGLFHVGEIDGRNTALSLTRDNLSLNTFVTAIQGNDINYNQGKFTTQQLTASGNSLSLESPSFKAKTNNYKLANGSISRIDSVNLQYQYDHRVADIFIPSLQWATSLSNLVNKKYHFTILDIDQPVLHIRDTTSPGDQLHTPAKDYNSSIDSLKVNKAQVYISSKDSSGVNGNFIASLNGREVKIAANHETLKLESGKLSGNFMQLSLMNLISHGTITSKNIYWHTDNIALQLKNALLTTAGKIDSISLNNTGYSSSGMNVQISCGKIYNIILPKSISANPLSIITGSPDLLLSHVNASYQSKYTFSDFNGIYYNHAKKLLIADSFFVSPATDFQTFTNRLQWQKDYIRFSSGYTVATGFDINNLLNDDAVDANRLSLNKANIFVYRDKRLPLKKDVMKPLPVHVMQHLSFSTRVDTTLINNSHISYTEVSPKTGQAGTVFFTNLDGTIQNVSNNNRHIPDSLRIDAKAKLLDTPLVSLYFAESYKDSSNSFVLNTSSAPFDLTILNSVLGSLYGAKIISGKVHKFYLHVDANREFAYGHASFLYNKLKFHLNNNADSSGKKLYSGLENFIANLIAYNRNYNRKGVVFYMRDPDKSFFNYWLKIVTSGITSSVIGERINHKYRHEYKKLIKHNNQIK